MAFDQSTRNRLSRFVSDARALLTEEFIRQLQRTYGIDPTTGEVTALDRLTAITDAERQTADLLRETGEHYLPGFGRFSAKSRRDTIERMVREQAFTVLNRLCALRMAEARGLLIESVAVGYQSRGFQLYARLAGSALGETGDAYRCYLFSIFDELAVDLPVLFDRFSPQGRLFPGETALRALLDLINQPELESLWAEDETIGWIYQYFNSKEERKAMRDASAAPRNSRELAVRNQFFTPRYVVEFLTDNTLGRIWYEMTRGQTSLVDSCRYLVRRPHEIFLDAPHPPTPSPTAEGRGGAEPPLPDVGEGAGGKGQDLSQEELLKQPVYIPHRPLKDPRTILMLDPACGSMHFGLYAFDLFERIYAEAWEWEGEHGASALGRAPMDAPLHDTYPSKDAFLRDVPRLIIERNIHGVDIDPRAAQIAGLSLWLRAQKSWREQGIKPQERPQIRRSNVVCAEPMPGDKDLLEEFITRQLLGNAEDKVVAWMLRKVFEAMTLAGEAGSLLKIEDEITAIVAEAKNQWRQGPRLAQSTFFANEAERIMQRALDLDASGLTDETFWTRAEERIDATLKDYAAFAEGAGAYRRRLFADDAARGFAFIDLCRKLYDVVLMNPPFGETSERIILYIEAKYPQWNKNLLCAFLERGNNLNNPGGATGAIFDRTVIVKSTYEDFRRAILIPNDRIATFADLGWEVLEANVEVTSCVLSQTPNSSGSLFFDARSVDATFKGDHLLELIACAQNGVSAIDTAIERCSQFDGLPNAVIGYDFPPFLRRAFNQLLSLEQSGFKANQGFALKADKHFRVWWEIDWKTNHRINRLFNGAGFSPYSTALIDCAISAVEPENLPMDSSTRKSGLGSHRISGVCFGKRGEYFCAHILPKGHIFTVEGQSIPVKEATSALEVLAYLNTPLIRFALNKYCGQHKYSGYVNLLPWTRTEQVEHARELVFDSIKTMITAQQQDELQSYFYVLTPKVSLQEMSTHLFELILRAWNTAKESEAFCDKEIARQLILTEEELASIKKFYLSEPSIESPVQDADTHNGCIGYTSHGIQSYSLGCVFGRWDIRYATGEKPAPELPDPFAPLPACPPGMLQNAQGLPAAPVEVPASYPLRISWPGILGDDEGHPEDIENRVREAIHVIWGEGAEAIEQEACQILGVRSLRDYFRKPALFFADHLQRYSKSRRQAPIYWPLSTRSGEYTLWLYYHRLSDQTLYSCVNDFVEPKLAQVAEQAAGLRRKSGRSAKEEKDLERLIDLEQELQDFRAELLRVAAFWKPNLNDGVQITAAPLWKLFQHKPWQKKLKETWEKLEAGEYDWAHLSYSIWPERVREKCSNDKSLAIAHDLEALYIEPPLVAGKKRGKAKQVVVDDDGEGMFGE